MAEMALSGIILSYCALARLGFFFWEQRMLVIRLSRGGAKKRPFYHVVVADKRKARDGRFVERIGFSNPVASGQSESVRVDVERFEHWVGVGAQPSPAVRRLMRVQRRAAAAADNG